MRWACASELLPVSELAPGHAHLGSRPPPTRGNGVLPAFRVMMKYGVEGCGSRGKKLWQYRTSVLYRSFRNCSALGVTDVPWLIKGFKLKNIKELRAGQGRNSTVRKKYKNCLELQSALCGDCDHITVRFERASKSALSVTRILIIGLMAGGQLGGDR